MTSRTYAGIPRFVLSSVWVPICTIAMVLIGIQACQAQDLALKQFRGPADLRNQRPYQLLFLAFSPETATSLAKGREAVGYQLDIANDLLIPARRGGPTVREDTETQRLAFKLARGMGGGNEFTVSAPIIARNGGGLDLLIQNYHHLVGWDKPSEDVTIGRNHVPMYQSEVILKRADGSTIVNAGPTCGVGDVTATIKHQLIASPWRSASVRAGVKLPTGSSGTLIGSGGTDSGIDLDANLILAHRLAFYTNQSYVWMGPDSHLANTSRRHLNRSMYALEYYTDKHTSWILQNESSEAAVHTGNAFADGTQSTLSLIIKHANNELTTWTYAFTENGDLVSYNAPGVANIAPDVTISIGLEVHR
jgi:hypothetical protein